MITRRHFLGAGLGAAAVGPWLGAGATTPIPGRQLLTATDVHVSDYPTVEAVRWFGKQLEARTNGRLTLRQYHSGQLGRESEAIDMARFGAIDITRVYSGALNNAFPLTQALCLPYVFDSVSHLRRAIDGHVGDSVLRSFEQRDLVGLAIYDSGARCFYNTKHPLHRPEDLNGLKLRVASSDIFLKLMRMLGANPTPMSLGETFSAMETHMIDGAENNMRSFQSSRHFEAAHYWSQSEHSYAPDVLVMSRKSFQYLRPADRALVVELARASVPVMRDLWDDSEVIARKQVIDYGVKLNQVDMPAFRAAAAPLLAEYRKQPQIEALYRVSDIAVGVASIALLGLVVVQGWQVMTRYVLNDSPSWTEPVTLLLLSTTLSLGAAAGVHTNRHFGFYLLSEHVPPLVRTVFDLIRPLMIMAIGAVLAWWSAALLLDGLDIKMAGAQMPQSINYLPLSIGGALMVVFALHKLWRVLRPIHTAGVR